MYQDDDEEEDAAIVDEKRDQVEELRSRLLSARPSRKSIALSVKSVHPKSSLSKQDYEEIREIV